MPANNHPYGTAISVEELTELMDHLIVVNKQAESRGNRKTPLCVWGRHGIGKTELIEAYAAQRGYRWTYIAPAQFEEMGDLLGMPRIEDGRTLFAPPAWVPQEKGPGILLIDDVNRADDRILRGIMQLLQNYELSSWKLPKDWHILLTANPDDGHYSVTPMDDALLTRVMHVQLTFDAKQWAKWAKKQGILPLGILFVLAHPGLTEGRRTSPRTLVQFFNAIADIENLNAQLGLVQTLGDACLDSETVADFIDFIDKGLWQLLNPESILNTRDFPLEVEQPLRQAVAGQGIRADILAALNTNLLQYIHQHPIKTSQLDNLKKYILLDFMPADLRLLLAQDLAEDTNTEIRSLLAIPEIGRLLIGT